MLANERVQGRLPPSRTPVKEETRKPSRNLTLTAKDLEDIKAGRYGRIQLPSQEEARYWLQQWREGIKRGQRRMQEESSR